MNGQTFSPKSRKQGKPSAARQHLNYCGQESKKQNLQFIISDTPVNLKQGQGNKSKVYESVDPKQGYATHFLTKSISSALSFQK